MGLHCLATRRLLSNHKTWSIFNVENCHLGGGGRIVEECEFWPMVITSNDASGYPSNAEKDKLNTQCHQLPKSESEVLTAPQKKHLYPF